MKIEGVGFAECGRPGGSAQVAGELLGGRRLIPPTIPADTPSDGEQPEVRYYDGAAQQSMLLCAALDELAAAGFKGPQVAVLSSFKGLEARAVVLTDVERLGTPRDRAAASPSAPRAPRSAS